MKTIQKTKLNEGLLVATAFAIWIGLGVSIDDRLIEYSGVWNLSGTLIFFVVGFFVAERPQGSFISRSQILKIASYFLWIAATQLLLIGENSLRTHPDLTITSSTLGLITIISPFAFYYLSTFLIRGYHTKPQYQTNEEAEQVGAGDAKEAV